MKKTKLQLKVMGTRITLLLLCLVLLFAFSGCATEKKNTINEEYLSHIAGKTFQSSASLLTFYKEGIATYDCFEHHYGYSVEVVETTDTYIKMLLTTVTVQSDDYIDNGPEEAIYTYADNSIEYYKKYTCLFDPGDSDYYSNTYGPYDTVCAEPDCKMFIAPSGNTKYCAEHAATCDSCGNYLDPGITYCEGCPNCVDCGIKLDPGAGIRCSSCIQKLPPSDNPASSTGGKCYTCNGTGYVKYYYGSSDLEAYLDGHDPYWFGECTSCGGTGKD